MIKLFTSTWMTVLLSAVTYLGTTAMLWKTPTPPVQEAGAAEAEAKPVAVETGPSWNFTNPEADQLVTELKAEKKSLEKREQQLEELSVRLQTQKTELNQASLSVHQLQSEFDQNLVRVQENETANLKRLSKVYTAMAPESAANIFAEMDDTSIVKIMLFMKDGDNAGILESFAKKGQPEAKRAAAISERLRVASARTTPAK